MPADDHMNALNLPIIEALFVALTKHKRNLPGEVRAIAAEMAENGSGEIDEAWLMRRNIYPSSVNVYVDGELSSTVISANIYLRRVLMTGKGDIYPKTFRITNQDGETLVQWGSN